MFILEDKICENVTLFFAFIIVGNGMTIYKKFLRNRGPSHTTSNQLLNRQIIIFLVKMICYSFPKTELITQSYCIKGKFVKMMCILILSNPIVDIIVVI